MSKILLSTLPDPERVKFALVRITTNKGVKRRGVSLRVHKRFLRWVENARDRPEFAIVVASLTVSAGEISQRHIVKRVLTPKVHGIPVRPMKPREFLLTVISPKVKGKEKIKMLQHLQVLINQALKEFKESLGLPEESPQAFCYSITEDVIEAPESEKCKEYLKTNAHSCLHILSGDMPRFLEMLRGQFPEDVDAVSRALKASKARDHLAAISVTGEGDDLNVTLVNAAGCRVTMKAWRFVQVITNLNKPVQIGEFSDSRRYQEPEVIFNNQSRGVVHALFAAEHASIEIICVDPDKSGVNALLDRSNIAIDLDYALSVVLVLDRLHQDKERVSRLVQALLTNAIDDSHRSLFTINSEV